MTNHGTEPMDPEEISADRLRHESEGTSDSDSQVGRVSRRSVLKGLALGTGYASFGGVASAILAACGSGPAQTASSAKAPSPKTFTGKLTVWHYFSAPTQVAMMNDYAALFEAAYPHVRVENVYVPYEQLPEKLTAAAGANSGPDVTLDNGGDTTQLAQAGVFRNITSEWASYPERNQFHPSVLKYFGGNLYAIQGYVNLLGLWYNSNLLAQAGVSPPRTFDDLTAAMGKIKAKKPSVIPLTLTGEPSAEAEWQAYPWLSGFGWSYSAPKLQPLLSTFSLIDEWVSKGYIPREAVTWGQTAPFQRFAVGNVLFAENGNWQTATAKQDAKFPYDVAPLPTGPEGGKIYLGGEAWGVGAFSKIPDIAWAYIETCILGKKGQLIPFKDVGSIPSRLDIVDLPEVKASKLLAPFAAEVSSRGTSYPPNVHPTKITNAELVVSKNWSALIAGQINVRQAAHATLSGVESALGQ
jgi:multiple sugar transport system substrate-binding protein